MNTRSLIARSSSSRWAPPSCSQARPAAAAGPLFAHWWRADPDRGGHLAAAAPAPLKGAGPVALVCDRTRRQPSARLSACQPAPGAGVSGAQVIKVRDPEQGDGRSLMTSHSSHPPPPKQQPRRNLVPIGERREESAFYRRRLGGGARFRAIADRKRWPRSRPRPQTGRRATRRPVFLCFHRSTGATALPRMARYLAAAAMRRSTLLPALTLSLRLCACNASFSAGGSPHSHDGRPALLINRLGMQMQRIPAGEFVMGNAATPASWPASSRLRAAPARGTRRRGRRRTGCASPGRSTWPGTK